jgi:hypothetical protein
VADLSAIPEDRSRPDPSDRSIHWLRENLEELLADNRSLSVDVH